MRRGSSTVVVVTGAPHEGLLRLLGRARNVTTIDADGGFDGAAEALRRAGGASAPYVVVAADPLREVATEWDRMWTPGAAARAFEESMGKVVEAWRLGRFEMPDYYVVIAPDRGVEGGARGRDPDDFYLGFLRSERPQRVATVPSAEEASEEAARVGRVLSTLLSGPWWPPLDRLAEAARSFFPGAAGARHGALLG